MEKPSKQKGETKKVPPVYSEEKLKALETAVNWIRNRQVFLIRQIQKNDISDKKLQEIGHFDKKLIERFENRSYLCDQADRNERNDYRYPP